MAPDKLSRDPGQSGDEPTEGVRIIAAEELEEVAERGEVAQRRSPGEPGYKDRPAPPPDDVSPAIRFPLPDSADPSDIVRPKPAPVVAPRAAGSVPDRPEAPAAADDDTTSVSLGEEAEPAAPSAPLDTPEATLPPPPPPVLDLGPSTGEHQLPHWTEPPTGEVPRVVIGEGDSAEDDDRWANYATGGGSGPRWRDERDSGQHDDLVGDLLAVSAADDEPVVERLGALDQTERVADDAYLNFDDVELDPRQRGRRGGRRGRGARSRPAAPAADPLAAIVADAPPKASTTGPVPIVPAAPAPASGGRPRLSAPPPPPDQDPAAPRQRRRPPEPPAPTEGGGGRNVPQAIAVGVALAVVALLVFKAGPAPAMVLVEIIVVLAGFEYYGAVLRGGFRPATLLGLTAVAALPLAAYWKGEAAFPMILFLTFVVGVLWYLLGIGGKVRPVANLGVTMVGVVWVGVMGAFAALILDIPAQGVSILVVAIVAAVAHDAGGFFIGRSMGRTPLSEISPNKTVEGLVGGILSALVAVFIVAVLFGVGPFSSGQALVFGLFTALIAPLGDLAESLFKRDLGLKDMGSILPQHGGILDRFDGMLFVLPTAYYVCRVLGLA